jgi:FtsP/CotA-like multicopper oxidase with cupredoxin domain
MAKTAKHLTFVREERIRLRLINVANACSFALNFECHFSQVIALDSHPIKPLRQSPVKLN